jgi:hypothetical protein
MQSITTSQLGNGIRKVIVRRVETDGLNHFLRAID